MRLYLTRAWRPVEVDPVRGINQSGNVESGRFIVVAEKREEADAKFLSYLAKVTRYRDWSTPYVEELVAAAKVPLEKRIEILGEIFTIVR